MKTATKKKERPSLPKLVLSNEQIAARLLRRRDAGKEAYSAADADLEELLKRGFVPGDTIAIEGGQVVEIIDNFAKGNKAWKPTGINRYDVKVSRASDVTSKL